MRTCSKCNIEYEDYGQRSSFCKPCRKSYDKAYYAKMSSDRKLSKQAKQLNLKRIKQRFLIDYLSVHPCESCGESDYVVLEFDHLDPNSKSHNISDMLSFSLENIQHEINKCRVLCANCHRRHTAQQFSWYQ
jgi:hypothetical protein